MHTHSKQPHTVWYLNGRAEHETADLQEAVVWAAMQDENVELSPLDKGKVRIHIGPLTLGYIEPTRPGNRKGN
jgi:hypothetical protein